MSEKSQREQLEAVFPEARLGSVKKAGASLTYVPVGEVINRLNEVLGASGWSWEVGKVWRDETNPEWVLAYGSMTATVDGETSTKAGEGGVKVKVMKSGELVDLGDEFKGAASDALKKAAQKFGVALYLARTDQARRYEQPADVFDPIEEGWASKDEYKTLTDSLYRAVKMAGPETVEKMRLHREKIGVAGPPSRAEYDSMITEFKSIVEDWQERLNPTSKASVSDEKAPEPSPPTVVPGEPNTASPAEPLVPGGWASDQEQISAHDALATKVEGLSEEVQERIATWRTEQALVDLPLSKTNLARLDAFVDALSASQPTLT